MRRLTLSVHVESKYKHMLRHTHTNLYRKLLQLIVITHEEGSEDYN